MDNEPDSIVYKFGRSAYTFEIITNTYTSTYYSDNNIPPCGHCIVTGEDNNTEYRIPRSVIAYYDGGSRQVSVCLDCILEGAKTLP